MMENEKLYVGRLKLTPNLIEEIKKNGGKLEGNVKDIMEMDKQYNDLLSIRGKIIDNSLSIERQVEILISTILFSAKLGKESTFFENFIMNTNHLSFSSKLRIFRSLYKVCSFLAEKESECKKIAANIKKIMETRDSFAHGEILFKDVKPPIIPYLFYYKENEPKEQPLNEEYFEKLSELYRETARSLAELRSHVNTSFKSGRNIEWDI